MSKNKYSVELKIEVAKAYLEYASDRMYINRWLYIRLLLNLDVK